MQFRARFVLIERYAKHDDASHTGHESEQLGREGVRLFDDGGVSDSRAGCPEGVLPGDLWKLRKVATANLEDRLCECRRYERADAVIAEYDDRPVDALDRLRAYAIERAVSHLQKVAHQ